MSADHRSRSSDGKMPTILGGKTAALVDTGPLVAAATTDDPDRERCQQALARTDVHLIVPVFVVSETAFMIAIRLGPRAEAAFLEAMAGFNVEHVQSEDWTRMSALLRTYADFPLGTVDASVVATAERLGVETIITLDHRHFRAIRPNHVPAFDLLPE